MKRPSKALKTLLWVSELRENQGKERFQRARRDLQEVERMLREITEKPKKLYQSLEGQTLKGADLQNFAWELEKVFEEKSNVERILAQKREEVEKLREQALRLHQKRRTAEVLYQKARRHYLQELERKEFQEIDDLTIMRRGQHETL